MATVRNGAAAAADVIVTLQLTPSILQEPSCRSVSSSPPAPPDLSASREYGIARTDLEQAARAGTLSYQIAHTHGNPWFRLIRSEVEAFCRKRMGATGLKQQQAKARIATAKREIRQLQKRLRVLQAQIADDELQR